MPDMVLAYWLLPAPPAQEFFRATVGRLAAQHDAPLFEPHLTLAVGSDSATKSQRILTGIASEPLDLPAAGIDFTSKFTRTLYLRFQTTPELEQLRNSLGLEQGKDDPFEPHVSLLYKSIPVEEQSRLAAGIKLPFQTVRFDALQVVRCRVPVATPADVVAWEVVASRGLAPCSPETRS
jgi:2'-5' RNA ligase